MPATTDVLMAIATSVVTLYGAQVTEHRMRKYGVSVEMSRLVTWLAENFGIDLAIAVGIMLPMLFTVSVATARGWSGVLGFLLGYQLLHAKFQWLSLKFEPEIDRVRAERMASPSKPLSESDSDSGS